jgi:hypothetical protein
MESRGYAPRAGANTGSAGPRDDRAARGWRGLRHRGVGTLRYLPVPSGDGCPRFPISPVRAWGTLSRGCCPAKTPRPTACTETRLAALFSAHCGVFSHGKIIRTCAPDRPGISSARWPVSPALRTWNRNRATVTEHRQARSPSGALMQMARNRSGTAPLPRRVPSFVSPSRLRAGYSHRWSHPLSPMNTMRSVRHTPH